MVISFPISNPFSGHDIFILRQLPLFQVSKSIRIPLTPELGIVRVVPNILVLYCERSTSAKLIGGSILLTCGNCVRPIHGHRPFVVRGNCDLPPARTCSIPPFALSQEAPLCSASPPPFARQEIPPICDFLSYPPFPVLVLTLYFGLATEIQPSHLASPRASSVSEANLVLTNRLLSSLPLSAAVRRFWCHDGWYERSDLWIQLTVYRRRHLLCR